MGPTDARGGGATTEGLENASYFGCGRCGATYRSTTIKYDGLGYPVCPACGARTGPSGR